MAKRYYGGDGSMISKDMSATANMPQNAVMRKYPAVPYAMYGLNDTITGIDYQMKSDMKGKKTGKMPEKY
jgi:hypothetical protein